ncbi:MAG: four helix bundle protein [Phycisphaerales bacterium]
MNTIRTFRDLIAWQKAMGMVQTVYEISSVLPDAERYGLISQMRRAAISIPSNIAEGYARQSLRDYIKHLRIARGSLAELMTQLELATMLKYIPLDQYPTERIEEVDRILQGLIRSLESQSIP